MTPKQSTLAELDVSINELKKSIDNVDDTKVKKELDKTLKRMIKARNKINPSSSFSFLYIVAFSFFLISGAGVFILIKLFKAYKKN